MAASNPQVGARGEFDLLGVGTNVATLDKSVGNAFQLNVLHKDGRFTTRPGFGTLARWSTTLNSGRNTAAGQADPSTVQGYTRILGSAYMVTNQGHEQILTIATLNAYSTDFQDDDAGTWLDPFGQFLQTLVLNVHDVTTDRRTELVFTSKTSDLSLVNDENLTRVLPQFLTNSTRDLQKPLYANPASVNFFQLNDVLYIILPGIGVWLYRPIDPIAQWDTREGVARRCQTANSSNWQQTGEQTALQRMVVSNGPFTESFVYYTPSTWQNPTCGCTLNNRVVWASDRTLYFSDADAPNHIIAANVYVIPSERPITALRSMQDRLVVFTETQVFIYQPSQGDALQSGGRLIEIANGTGAVSPNHVVRFQDTIAFVDTSGVHVINGSQVVSISDPIASWFQNGSQIQNPATSFKVANGLTGLVGDQPRARIDLIGQMATCNMAWHDFTQTLYITFDDLTLVWRQTSGWTIWLYETDAIGLTVGLKKNILHPWLLPGDRRVFMVSGPHSTGYLDVDDHHLLVAELGRGGSMDVSSASQEDRRTPSGYWQQASAIAGDPAVWLGRPIKMPFGWRTQFQITTADTWLVPVMIQVDAGVADFTIRANFNNSDWKFLLNSAPPGSTGEVDFVVANDRIPSQGGWQRFAMDATHQVKIYQGGVPSNTGNEIRMDWAGAGGTWLHAPALNIANNEPQVLIWLPMQRVAPASTTVLDMGWSLTQFNIDPGGLNTPGRGYAWMESKSYPAQSLANDALSQPTDWCLMSRAVGPEGDVQVKMRGIWATVQSYGMATERSPSDWLYGPLNTNTAADQKAWSGQRMDWLDPIPGISDIAKPDSIRARMKPLNLTLPTSYKTGANIARWSSILDPSKGNLLIDDPATDTIATSEGIRGETFSTMLFGSLCHPGESVAVQAAKASYVIVGGRRRTGR